MRTKLLVLLAGIGLFIIMPSTSVAQPGREKHHSPHALPHQQHSQHPHSKKANLDEVATVKGKITEWTYNDFLVYEGFILESEGKEYTVRFPRNLATQLMELKENITVVGFLRYNPEGKLFMDLVSAESNGKKVDYGTPNQLQSNASGKAKVKRLYYNKKGYMAGYILDNNVVLLLISNNAAKQLNELIDVGTELEYTGKDAALKHGEATVDNLIPVIGQTITLEGKQYLIF